MNTSTLDFPELCAKYTPESKCVVRGRYSEDEQPGEYRTVVGVNRNGYIRVRSDSHPWLTLDVEEWQVTLTQRYAYCQNCESDVDLHTITPENYAQAGFCPNSVDGHEFGTWDQPISSIEQIRKLRGF